MNLNELRDKRDVLEGQVQNLLEEFQKDTGVTITEVDWRQGRDLQTVGAPPKNRLTITIEL